MDTLDHLDVFESVFRKAEQEQFEFHPVSYQKIVVVHDENISDIDPPIDELKGFSAALHAATQWETVVLTSEMTVDAALTEIKQHEPDLIVTWRHLCEGALVPHHTLGVFVDVMTQVLPQTILLMPGTAQEPKSIATETSHIVLVATDHLAGDHRLVNAGAAMTDPQGQLVLCHVEDDLVFGRYLHAISRIPEVNTDLISKKLREELLGNASQYIQHARQVLSEKKVPLSVESQVLPGHRLQTYRDLILRYKANLLVMNTKDEGQLAMHGLAYSMAVEFVDLPQLLL